ncbi:MAG: type VI secretion system protein TssA [Pirellula sp.]|nr:type VI secretion system protein TssA [Pirellula sp.]
MSDDLRSLFVPVSPESPSGSDLEYDPDFAAMEKASQGTSEQEFGATVIEGSPPDWNTVRQLAMKLLARSKDLRIASYLVQAELDLRGLIGLRDGLEYISDTVNNYWDTCFPLLDPDDDNDPTIRINALLSLTKPGGVIRQVRTSPLAKSRSVGLVSLQDVMIAKGDMPPPDGMDDPPTLKKVEAVFRSGNMTEHQQLLAAVDESIEFLKKIEEGFSSQVGINDSPDFDPLLKELRAISKTQSSWIATISPEDESGPSEVELSAGPGTASAEDAIVKVSASTPFSVSKLQIASRNDAIECLAKIIAWFEKNEPSSPLPMLLRRARRLSNKSFLEILRDISPDGINQALLIGGPESEEDESPATPAAKPSKEPEKAYSPPPPSNDSY